jgi:hypothetical protein
MSKTIPFSEISDKWFQNPGFVREYEALEEEFALATALITARSERLEGGKSRPSTTTLAKFAKATGTRLRVSFEREGA